MNARKSSLVSINRQKASLFHSLSASSSRMTRHMAVAFIIGVTAGLFIGCGPRKGVTTYELPHAVSAANGYGARPGGAPRAEPLPAQESDLEAVAPGVVFRMESGVDSALNTTIEIPEDGNIVLPYERRMKVEYSDRAEFQRQLNALYAGLYRNGAGIRVKIEEPTRYVYIGGLVQNPGHYRIRSTGSFQELFSLAGGLENEPNTGRSPRFAIVQNQLGVPVGAIDLQSFFRGSVDTSHFQWRGAERIFVQIDPPRRSVTDTEAGTIQILGQVLNPGEYPVTGNADFFSYLALAGGPTAEADLRLIEVIRQSGTSVTREQWSVEDNTRMPALIAGDMLVVGARQPATVVPTVTGVLGALSAAIIAAVALQ